MKSLDLETGHNWDNLGSFVSESEYLTGKKDLELLMKEEFLFSENIADNHLLFGYISEGRNHDINQTLNYMNLLQLLEDKQKL